MYRFIPSHNSNYNKIRDINKKKPPIIVFVDGISLIPNKGNHTQKFLL